MVVFLAAVHGSGKSAGGYQPASSLRHERAERLRRHVSGRRLRDPDLNDLVERAGDLLLHGFACVKFLHLPIIGVSIFALAAAILNYTRQGQIKKMKDEIIAQLPENQEGKEDLFG